MAKPPPANDANLDYARKKTDLILDRLEDQLDKQDVDESLLEKLAGRKTSSAGLLIAGRISSHKPKTIPPPPRRTRNLRMPCGAWVSSKARARASNRKSPKTSSRDLQDAYRGRVPLEYQEQVKQYLKGTSKSQESE